MSTILPPIVSRDEIQRRLKSIFPEGTPNRNYCVREMAASTVFSMLYVGAIEGADTFLAPKHVYRMTDQQALKLDARPREAYASAALRPGFAPRGRRWYADNSREPIRDETLREGLMTVGAVSARRDLATTSARPRYSLARDFAALFDPSLTGSSLEQAMSEWRERNLSAGALARVDLLRGGITASEEGVLVRFPNGETRRMAPGPSSDIVRHVVEVFAPRFLERPGVLWLSESQAKVVHRDDALASRIGLDIDPQKNLPDLILVDLGPADPFLLFVEVVATDGAMTVSRQNALLAIATGAGFRAERVAFMTAYRDRGAAAFKKTVQDLAWRSFAWFMSEPEHLVMLVDGTQAATRLGRLIDPCTPGVTARPAG